MRIVRFKGWRQKVQAIWAIISCGAIIAEDFDSDEVSKDHPWDRKG